jgi:isoaspartyl peptidase/L-asparaginase-like protein (Ntn-hydrolase superfamily)
MQSGVNCGGAVNKYSFVLHGGTVTDPNHVTAAQLELIQFVVTEAGVELASGASALDTVVRAIVRLEDSGLLDAGKGSFLNAAGFVENDASLMQGHTGNAGAVAAMPRLKNPIEAARIAMNRTPHVLFVGKTGEETLVALGAEEIDNPSSYFTPAELSENASPNEGTVGAVALDQHGHLAAGTSTGGRRGQLPGRVGDSPIIGAGTFANESYALSATGDGEAFIRRCAAQDIAARASYCDMSLQVAADHVIHQLIGDVDKTSGAIIAIGQDGGIVLSSNVYGVRHGYTTESRNITVGARVQ